eukprot:TRINITY_DN135_c0_g1_i1.p1 TRINITY_DN135_c0_g1~~TRINITY_DN135_c0_g1_i1.p1  ORF type:complete len:313 (-),score=86.63 TRINITY_DN135_c0_g1_i1:115-1053(-)
MVIFTCTITDNLRAPSGSKKEDLKVFVEGPDTDGLNINVMGGSRGAYHIGLTPREAGQHWFDFQFKGEFVGEPYMLPVSNRGDVPDFDYSGIHRSGAPIPVVDPTTTTTTTTTATLEPEPEPEPVAVVSPEHCSISGNIEGTIMDYDIITFQITANDEDGNTVTRPPSKFIVQSDTVSGQVTDKYNGTFDARIGPFNQPGQYDVHVTYEGKDIQGSPFQVNVEGFAGGSLTSVKVSFTFSAVNTDGSIRSNGGDNAKFNINAGPGNAGRISDLRNGNYSFVYEAVIGEENTVDVVTDDGPMQGFPIRFVPDV